MTLSQDVSSGRDFPEGVSYTHSGGEVAYAKAKNCQSLFAFFELMRDINALLVGNGHPSSFRMCHLRKYSTNLEEIWY
jgi:hypothetical protein